MIKVIIVNCNGIEITREYDSIEQFILMQNSNDGDLMLDDEVKEVYIDNQLVDNSNIESVNDLVELLEENDLGYCCCCVEKFNYNSLTNYKSELYCKECFSKYSINR